MSSEAAVHSVNFAGTKHARDVSLPSDWLSVEDSAATTGLLFVTDLTAQFAKLLKLKTVPYGDMLRLLEGNASDEALEALWDLYLGLLSLAIKVIRSFQSWKMTYKMQMAGECFHSSLHAWKLMSEEALQQCYMAADA